MVSSVLLIGIDATAQLEDGMHAFSNDEVTFYVWLAGGGETIENSQIFYVSRNETHVGTGYFRTFDDEENEVTFEWYEIQTEYCNYNFDLPGEVLVLQRFDCSNGEVNAEFTLNRVDY